MFENCSKSKYSQGYDPKFKEPETIEMLEIGENAIIEGYSKNTLAKLLVEEAGLKYINAQSLAAKMWKNVMATGKNRGDGLQEKNIQRLEHIYKRCMELNDFKNALSALDQLNKLMQLYKEKIQITTDEYFIDLLQDGEKETN